MKKATIHALPHQVINQIAAAEVVHRPATVVKELLENAIDAGSKKIKLITEEGGKQLIQIIDDGKGMSEVDILESFKRHTTSKIATVEDLFKIETLGFRGEALASIAQVAQLEIISKTQEQTLAHKIVVEANQLKKKIEVNAPSGTQISVKKLFFNTPARRNFLKSTPVENKHIIEEFQRAALNHPTIAFSYQHNDHIVYNLPAAKLTQRVVHLFGKSYEENLLPFQEKTDKISLYGYITPPTFNKKTRVGQYTYVNHRYIKNNFIHYAIKKTFEGLAPPNTFPFYILYLTLPPHSIDVHIHPMKTEVKFEEEALIFTTLTAAIKKALALHHAIPSIDFSINVNQSPFITTSTTTGGESNAYTQFRNTFTSSPKAAITPPTAPTLEEKTTPSQVKINTPSNRAPNQKDQKTLINIHNRYVITSIKSGALLIDIKAAHERIFYEKYTQQLSTPSAPQYLLFPAKVTLSPNDFSLLLSCQEQLKKLGFRIQATPPDTLTFVAQPQEVQGKELQELTEELLEQYKSAAALPTTTQDDLWARTLAKRITAYKVKQSLTPTHLQSLVDQLFACKNANYTPDGTKIWKILSLSAIEELMT